jgi:hypothetical protein
VINDVAPNEKEIKSPATKGSLVAIPAILLIVVTENCGYSLPFSTDSIEVGGSGFAVKLVLPDIVTD